MWDCEMRSPTVSPLLAPEFERATTLFFLGDNYSAGAIWSIPPSKIKQGFCVQPR